MAKQVLPQADNYRFDAKHTLRVNFFSDYDKLKDLSEEHKAPTPKQFESKANLRSWLLDPLLRDQFVVRHGNETEVWYNDPYRKANEQGRELCYAGEREKFEKKKLDKVIRYVVSSRILSRYLS